MTTQPSTRIDSPHCTGQILAANAYGQYHTTYTVGVEGEQLSVKRNSPKVDSSPLDPPEPSGDELRTLCNTIYQRMMTFRYSSAFDLLRGQLAEAREHGRQEVAKRLPRLWGCWTDATKTWKGGWGTPFATSKWFVCGECGVYENDQCVREFDPMTGGPKG